MTKKKLAFFSPSYTFQVLRENQAHKMRRPTCFLLNLSNHGTEHFKYPSVYQWEQFSGATIIHNY